jgi:protein involved in polysaccharide export with SLBB domain
MGIDRDASTSARVVLVFVLLAVAAIFPQLAPAQANPTPAQLETFKNLPPEQQKAVLEAMSGSGADGARRDPQLSTTATSVPVQAPAPAVDEPPRVAGGSTLLLDVVVREALREDETRAPVLESRRERVLKGNPYRLDGEGRIALPISPPINLAGLTDEQAAQLLNADPRLAGLQFKVTLLPVEPAGAEGLKPFGYDLFDQVPTTFAPATDIPVPADYRIGPGDNITVELFGKKTGRYQLVVDRNGALTLPEFGPIQVTGLSFDDVRAEIDQRVAAQMIGVRASVTMGQLRSIRVFVVGDVVQPGAYTVSGLSTITNALFASGGVATIGSLRNIELKRGGRTVARLDLYDLLLRGDTSKDLLLEQGDAIFVPAVGSTAAVAGEVRRPAIYEFRNGGTVGELVELAGGLNPAADPRLVRLERIDAHKERTVLDLDLSSAADRSRKLVSGDVLTIPQVLADTRGVTLEGYVHRAGAYAWREGMRLTDLLGSLQAFKVNADQRYVLIRREHAPNRRVEVISADATAAFQQKNTSANPLLQSRDRVIVFSRQADRGDALAEILGELRLQTRDNSPLPVVTINGRVRAPGEYPLEAGMTVGDLIRAGGGLDDAAYAATAELTRYEVVNGHSRKTEVLQLDLSPGAALADGSAQAANADTPIRAYDVLVIKETPDWREQEAITLRGEVRFPGVYPIRYGERLSSVIARAGGLTEAAFADGSVFMREELKEQERQQVERLAGRLQSDLTLVALQNSQAQKENTTETLAAGQSLLAQLRNAKPTGRLVIDLERALAKAGGEDDIELRSGDQLVIPRTKPYVTVIGEVQNATSHVWKDDLARDHYVQLSGGTTPRADNKRIYVVRANGSVVAAKGSRWFGGGGNVELEPGDTIVVPVDAERMRPLPLWTAVTTIVYNMAVAVAAIGSL